MRGCWDAGVDRPGWTGHCPEPVLPGCVLPAPSPRLGFLGCMLAARVSRWKPVFRTLTFLPAQPGLRSHSHLPSLAQRG